MLMWWKSLSLSWFADAIFICSHLIRRFQFQLLARSFSFLNLRRFPFAKFMRTMRAFACHCSSNKCTKCVESTPHSLHSYRHHCYHCHRHRHQRSRFLKVLRETLKQCQYVYHSHLSKIYLVYSRNELKEKTNRLLSTYRRPPSSTKFHSAVFIPQFDIYVCVCACI